MLRALIDAQTPVVCIFGKSWNLHVTAVLGTTLEENLAMIADSVAFLKKQGKEVVYDAEHFFDGFRADQDYALASIKAAAAAGADWVTLCDTNGGSLPSFVTDVIAAVAPAVPTRLGIHSHNDSDLAVANALAGGRGRRARMVQGTINGWGERCGNANLISIIPALQLKMDRRCVTDENLARLTELSRAVSEIANIRPRAHAPYVGALGVRAQGRHARRRRREADRTATSTCRPSASATSRHIVVSELAGRGNVRMRAIELGVDVQGNERALLERIKDLESQGYQFEAAEGSFELLGRRSKPGYAPPFEVLDVVVISERRRGNSMFAEATVKLRGGRRDRPHRRRGRGPRARPRRRVSQGAQPALPAGARRPSGRLQGPHPRPRGRDRCQDPRAHRSRAGHGGEERWSTIGVSPNIIEASATALADAMELPLVRARA